jgi:amino-acid N-acetyltransferase
MTLPISHRIVPASPDDLADVRELLRATGLADQGLEPFVDTVLVSRSRGQLIGCAALEIYGSDALLRSVAVDVGWQSRGLGHALVDKATALATSRGVSELYLLTLTAEEYFVRLGFTRCARADAPTALQQSIEFTTICPESATAMRKSL